MSRPRSEGEAGGEFVRSLERGLAVLRSFSADHPAQSLSDVARRTGLTRATARRLLLTLERLGYVRSDGRAFRITPKVLDIGYAYLSSLALADLAQPEMEAVVARTHESCSAAVLDGADVVYVARVPTNRIMTISLGLGSRLPAFATSLGRVLLADLPPAERDALLSSARLERFTARTVTDPDALRAELDLVRTQGWALVDQELEQGLRSVAAPLRDRSGTVAAMNVSAHATRVSLERMRKEFVPLVVEGAARISDRLRQR